MPRKTLCTPELTARIEQSIVAGLSYRDACEVVGISETAFYEWIQRGEAESDRTADGHDSSITEQPFVVFADTIKKSIPKRKETLLHKIRSDESWQSAAWLLERLHPQEFSRHVKVESNQPVVALEWDGIEDDTTEATDG